MILRLAPIWQDRLGPNAHFGVGDVTKAADIARVCESAVAKFGPITGLVNNAGKNSYADPVKMTEAEWEDVLLG